MDIVDRLKNYEPSRDYTELASEEAPHLIQQLRNRVKELEESNKLLGADGDILEQLLTDPENQPSQFGTVPLEWYENLENKLERIRFKVGVVVDSLDGSYEKHAIRKALQEAIE